MKIYWLLGLMMVLLVQPVESAYVNDNHLITDIPKCYGDVLVKVRGNAGVNVYDVIPCKPGSARKLWQCKCGNDNTEIYFRTNVTSQYDIVIEYFIEPKTGDEFTDDNYKRTVNFNNIKFEEKPFIRKVYDWPKNTSIILVVFVLLAIISIIGFGVYHLIKKVFMSEWDKDDEEDDATKDKDSPENEIQGILKDL